ncbi:MAG TPA: M56 family metallopeptidase [Tepidisphaeraceae bacterium]|nr:M56 family metallopeptidase [Tepidisphaeraceae bacterium]
MSFPHDLLSCAAAERLGLTLVHFGWQGAVIAAVLAVALRLMRRSPAGARYALCCAAIGAMAATPPATFWLLPAATSGPAETRDAAGPGNTLAAPPHVATAGARRRSNLNVRAPVDGATEARRPMGGESGRSAGQWVTVAWAAGVAALLARLLLNGVSVGLLRRSGVPLPPVHRDRLRNLARRVGLRRTPRVLQSTWLEVPTVVGWVRPLVFLPAGLLSGLTAFEVEAILAHEFAHIRRRDYLVNLLQSLVEVFLFYHPAVWWVSARIRAERENCCDDRAAEVCGDRVRYARMLARLEGLRTAPAQAVLAAGGGVLLSRVRRLLNNSAPGESITWRPLAGSAVVLLCSAFLCVGGGPRTARAQGVAPDQRLQNGVTPPRPGDRPPADAAGADGIRNDAAAAGGARPNLTPARPAGRKEPAPSGGPGAATSGTTSRVNESAPSLSSRFDRVTGLSAIQNEAIAKYRRFQEPLSHLRTERQAFGDTLSHEQRRRLREAMAGRRVPPLRNPPASDELRFLSEGQRQSFLDLHRRQMELESAMGQARREVFSLLTPDQRKQLQAIRTAQPAPAASNGPSARRAAWARGVVERVDGQGVVIRSNGSGGTPKLVRLETGEGTTFARDGRTSSLSELEPGDLVRVHCPAGVAVRVESRSRGPTPAALRQRPRVAQRINDNE